MAAVVDIHVKSLRDQGYQNLQAWLEANPNHVYVGRDKTFFVKEAIGSKWKNPYEVKKYGLEKSLEMYAKHVVDTELFQQLDELAGKTLGCWCVNDPKPLQSTTCQCHAQLLCHLLQKKQQGWTAPR